jgi:hypothetical protein
MAKYGENSILVTELHDLQKKILEICTFLFKLIVSHIVLLLFCSIL